MASVFRPSSGISNPWSVTEVIHFSVASNSAERSYPRSRIISSARRSEPYCRCRQDGRRLPSKPVGRAWNFVPAIAWAPWGPSLERQRPVSANAAFLALSETLVWGHAF
jgi:hypothetical protein